MITRIARIVFWVGVCCLAVLFGINLVQGSFVIKVDFGIKAQWTIDFNMLFRTAIIWLAFGLFTDLSNNVRDIRNTLKKMEKEGVRIEKNSRTSTPAIPQASGAGAAMGAAAGAVAKTAPVMGQMAAAPAGNADIIACPQCGNSVNKASAFCGKCGYKMN